MEICINIIPGFSNARREGSVQTLSRAASLSLSLGGYPALFPLARTRELGKSPVEKRHGGVDGKAVVMVKYK